MKKLPLIILATVLAAAFCLAEEQTAPSKASPNVGEIQTVDGKVESINLCSEIQCGNRSKITIVDKNGEKFTFEIRTGIGVKLSANTKLLSLKDLEKGDRVTIEYMITKSGAKKVLTIEVSKYKFK